MANIIDYVTWRGDLSFQAAAFNPVDAMVLCEITCFPFDHIVPADFTSASLTISEACKAVVLDPLPPCCKTESPKLKELAESSVRFGSIRITGFRNIVDKQRGMQFCAAAYQLPDGLNCIIFRGTDNTIIGWKEDFDLAYDDEVPAQAEAIRYLKEAASHVRGKLIVGGHSKGGNLAMYSSAFAGKRIHNRIRQIYNFDGPGFNEHVIQHKGFLDIVERIKTYVPQDSLFGLLLEHKGPYLVIHSNESTGLKEHNLYTWHVTPFDIERERKISETGENYRENISEWLDTMSMEERKAFVNVVFDLVDELETIDGLFSARTLWKVLKAFRELPSEDKKVVTGAIDALRKTILANVKEKRNEREEERAKRKREADAGLKERFLHLFGGS